MNKKLLVAAVGAALVVGPLAANATGTTLYGSLHMSIDSTDNGYSTTGAVNSNSSRFGIKGDDDLGGGLKAIYQAEFGAFNMDTGSNGLSGTMRNTFLGFAGSWGAVKVGRYDSPFKELGRKLDNFNEQVGDARNILGDGTATGAGTWDNRMSNMIRYESPDMSGWSGTFAHTSNNGADGFGNTVEPVNSFGVNWSAGPMFVGFAYLENGIAGAPKDKEKGMRLAGSYTFNDVTLGAIYEDLRDLGGYDVKHTVWGLMASMKMANNLFKFHYYNSDNLKGSDAPPFADQTGGKLWAIGVDHTFSKMTKVYFNYAKADNDDYAANGVASGNAGHGETLYASTDGKSVKGYSVGMILKF